MSLRTNDIFGKFCLFKTVCSSCLLEFKCGFRTRSNVNSRHRFGKGEIKLCSEFKFARGTIFQKIIRFSALLERLLVFKFWDWFKHVGSEKIELRSKNIMYFNWCDLEQERNCNLFNNLLRMFFFCFRKCSTKIKMFSHIVLRTLNFIHLLLVDFPCGKALFRFNFANEWRFQAVFLFLAKTK